MKFCLLFLGFSVVLSEYQCEFTTKYIDMPLDHFSFTNNKTFKLRYLLNDTYFSEGRPIFFYTGNEGDISMFAQNTGFMIELAQTFDALIIFAEHRFYGETLPCGNDSYKSLSCLGYLSAQQALADFVYLIDDLQEQYAPKSDPPKKLPVIAFGGSYGGMLSAWLRIKYPYAVIGSIASSAPIWQFKNLTPCGNFNKIVTDVVQNLGSEKCMNTIKDSWKTIRTFTSDDKGKTNISSIFNLCKPLQTESDVEVFVGWLSEIYTNLVMVNYPYPTSFLVPLPGNPVRSFCYEMDNYNDNNDVLRAISKGLEVYTNFTRETKCNDILVTASNLGETGWDFQSCTDMIMPMCSTDEDMFENAPWDFKEFSDDCYSKFSIRPRNEKVPILEFGGKDLEAASNIIFSNGLLDPWSSGGVLQNISSQVFAVLIPDGAHHFDLRGANELDSESVKSARDFHSKHISKWIDKFYFKNLPETVYLSKTRKYMTHLSQFTNN